MPAYCGQPSKTTGRWSRSMFTGTLASEESMEQGNMVRSWLGMLEVSLGSLDALALTLAAGRFTSSPFPERVIDEARTQWFSVFGDELEVCRKVEGQLCASLKLIGDPDWKIAWPVVCLDCPQ
eukprot:6087962-Amphidinium_carterae.2